MKYRAVLVMILSFPWIALGAVDRECILRGLRMAEDILPFTVDGEYQTVYDIIVNLQMYQRAMNQHVEWIRRAAQRSASENPVIIEAGGGTGNMTLAAQQAVPESRVHLLDLNEGMTQYAQAKGVPEERIHISDITQMQIRGESVQGQSVDHVFSHSVIWGLNDPNDFFEEASRVLKPSGTLAVSTVNHLVRDDGRLQDFLGTMKIDLDQAVQLGRITASQRDLFLEQNARIGEAIKTPLSLEELRSLGNSNGLELVSTEPCYVIDTPEGPVPFFEQVLFQKKQN